METRYVLFFYRRFCQSCVVVAAASGGKPSWWNLFPSGVIGAAAPETTGLFLFPSELLITATQQNVSLFNNSVDNRNGSPAILSFPGDCMPGGKQNCTAIERFIGNLYKYVFIFLYPLHCTWTFTPTGSLSWSYACIPSSIWARRHLKWLMLWCVLRIVCSFCL